MGFDNQQLRELAERIYDLDTEVYDKLGSSLGRVFTGERENTVKELAQILVERKQGYLIRSELALISNMARTIPDKEVRKEVMNKYHQILHETMNIPTSFGGGDILDPRIADLNTLNLKDRFGEDDHLIICIGRTYGCGGNEIGFTLADELKMNFYDVSVVNEMLRRREADHIPPEASAFRKGKTTPIQWLRNFKQFHGLPRRDVQFFDSSRLICEMARREDFIIMGRFADAILTNNHIPHISIFVTAPVKTRVHRLMEINDKLSMKDARIMIEREDRRHAKIYKFYTGRKWAKPSNYDLCINSASYGIKGAVELIKRVITRVK